MNTCNNVDESKIHYIKQNKPDQTITKTKTKPYYDSTYMRFNNRKIDVIQMSIGVANWGVGRRLGRLTEKGQKKTFLG